MIENKRVCNDEGRKKWISPLRASHFGRNDRLTRLLASKTTRNDEGYAREVDCHDRKRSRNDGSYARKVDSYGVSRLAMTGLLVMLLLLGAVLFASCEVGLGEAVDLQGAKISLTNLKDDDCVPHAFTVMGVASDNEDVKRIQIDFGDANIKFVWSGNGWSKTTKAGTAVVGDELASCTRNANGSYSFSVYVDLEERTINNNEDDATFLLAAKAFDAMENLGPNSQIEVSLTMDEKDPSVSVNKPQLFVQDRTSVETATANYKLKESLYLSRLMNGVFEISGRQDGATSFKELRIELDNMSGAAGLMKSTGDETKMSPPLPQFASDITCEEIASKNLLSGDADVSRQVYFVKTLKKGEKDDNDHTIQDLRNWTIKVPNFADSSTSVGMTGTSVGMTGSSDGMTGLGDVSGLETGKQIIRIVTTSVSDTGAWQRKVQGYFVWWPESDEPWIKVYGVSDTEPADWSAATVGTVYPSSDISAVAYDDDGIEKVEWKIEKRVANGSVSWVNVSSEISTSSGIKTTLTPPDKSATSMSMSLPAPSETTNYRLTLKITDVKGNSNTSQKYFKTLDVKAPKITITAPQPDKNILDAGVLNANGQISFQGNIVDDGEIKAFYIVHLDGSKSSDSENMMKYMNGKYSGYASATTQGFNDSGNIIYKMTLPKPVQASDSSDKIYNWSKNVSVIGRNLTSQQFVFCAIDAGDTASTQIFSVSGDKNSPEIKLESITYKESAASQGTTVDFYEKDASGKYTSTKKDAPTLPKFTSATLNGHWSDDSTRISSLWTNKKTITVSWAKASGINVVQNVSASNYSVLGQTWSATITGVPGDAMGFITVSVQDCAGNSKSDNANFYVSSDQTNWASVSSDNDDGTFKSGDKIIITTEFNKNVKFSGGGTDPQLKLNTTPVRYATYKSGNASGANTVGSKSHKYEYTVQADDVVSGGGNLNVIAIVTNGNAWVDGATGKNVLMTVPTGVNSLSQRREIKLDTTAPEIKTVKQETANGDYKAGKQLMFSVEFSEDVSILNPGSIHLTIVDGTNATKTFNTTDAFLSGTKKMLFSYTTKAGDNYESLKITSLSLGTGVSQAAITDVAGNPLQSTTFAAVSTSINVDTTAPDFPTVKLYNGGTTDEITSSSFVCYEDVGVKFVVTGESGARIEYTTDGASWLSYTQENSGVTLSTNGNYAIKARQTDKAGNLGPASATKNVTIDKGALLSKISSTTDTGTYNAGKDIFIDLIFRRSVTFASGVALTLNAKNGSTAKTATLDSSTSVGMTSVTGTSFTFKYTVAEGDAIDSDGVLEVTAIPQFTVNGENKTLSSSDWAGEKSLSSNREIKILTGKPQVVGDPVISEETIGGVDYDKIEITFDRDITKQSGNITLTQTDDFSAPAVLTESEYNTYASKISGGATALQTYYEVGTNGATLSGTTLSYDTSTKYILKYNYEITNTTLTGLFTAANCNKVIIPSYASEVEVSGKKLTVHLNGSYRLPTKGGVYTLEMPQGFVADAVSNKSNVYSKTAITASGVEKPSIRIKKSSGGRAETIDTSNKTATQPYQTQMKMECRTSGATVYYTASLSETAETIYEGGKDATAVSPKASPSVSTSSATQYKAEVTLASGNNNNTGLKIPVRAEARKDGKTSKPAYEYVCRSVVHFEIGSGFDQGYQCASNEVKDMTYDYDPNAKIVLHVKGWDRIHYWGGDCGSTNWPGVNMQPDTAKGGDWHTITLSGTETNLLFNYQNNENWKTSDQHQVAGNWEFEDGTWNGTPLHTPIDYRLDMRMWIRGGDSDNGKNGVEGFPLSWDATDPNGIHLMTGNYTSGQGTRTYQVKPNMQGNWYYVTWEITKPACFGFLLGDVPSDAVANGPSHWIWGSCAWTSYKNDYKLYPGETLHVKSTADSRYTGMDSTSGPSHGSFDFKDQDLGSR